MPHVVPKKQPLSTDKKLFLKEIAAIIKSRHDSSENLRLDTILAELKAKRGGNYTKTGLRGIISREQATLYELAGSDAMEAFIKFSKGVGLVRRTPGGKKQKPEGEIEHLQIEGGGIPAHEVPEDCCMWPVNEKEGRTLFCGQPALKKVGRKGFESYCGQHQGRSGKKVEEVTKKTRVLQGISP